MKKRVLKKAYQDETLIGIRTINIDWDESIIGFITIINENSITINEIDKNGYFIGKTEIEINDIVNIDIDDRYQKRLLFIHKNLELIDKNKGITIWKEGIKIIPNIKDLIQNKKITTLFFDEDNYITGYLKKISDSYVMIEAIGSEGDADGFSYYPINKIIGLRYDGIEEQKIKLLNENYKLFY